MKQLGNLAIVCAQRKDVMLCMFDGNVHVSAGIRHSQSMSAAWDDNEKILQIIHELNFGSMAEKRSG